MTELGTNSQKRATLAGLVLFRLRPYWKKQISSGVTADFSKWALSLLLCSIFCLLTSPGFARSNHPPEIVSLLPASSSCRIDETVYFTTTYSDPNGASDIESAYLLINLKHTDTDYFFALYKPQTNVIYVNGVSGAFSPGSAKVMENKVAKLDCARTSVTKSSNSLSVKWAISFKSAFAGAAEKKIYLQAIDKSSSRADWQLKGTILVRAAGNNPPEIIAVQPAFALSHPKESLTLKATYSDPDGAEDIENAYLLINTSASQQDYFFALYIQRTNVIFVNGVTGAFSPGENRLMENNLGQLDLSGTTVSRNGNTLTINWAVSFKPVFAATTPKRIYLSAIDKSFGRSGWVQKGSCAVLTPAGNITINSSDNKVKLDIPQVALLTPPSAEITVTNLNVSGLQQAAPNPQAVILAAVECLPEGQQFNPQAPVSLTFSLPEAQIPGTPIALGRYDAGAKKFLLTGATKPISSDGYSVTFAVTHFSKYAAISAPNYGPIGLGVKIPLPDMLTGSFSHALPITVPPGRRGIQPALSLTYRSSNSNSWTGVGFSLNPGYIVRSTRLGPATYNDSQDTFYVITDAGTTELVHLVDNLYQAKIESSFTKFFKESDDSWRALGKEGSLLFFGQMPDSKEVSSQGSFSWYLSEVRDTNGNYIRYAYIKDKGKVYLERIDYTGNTNGTSPTNTVKFNLEDRQDKFSSLLSGSVIATEKRLKSIEVSVRGDLVWRYELEYGYSPDSKRSLLKTFIQSGFDNSGRPIPLPQQKFEYQENSP